ncbi:aminotransferase class IV family protein [Catenuloplanes sp. NPDC051500]|uniref:aminotransferase class IV family protein n=1 Tax=Catenuloplanes sp. NPDC051500 TaxID=3363959 RepID=UPI00378E63DA
MSVRTVTELDGAGTTADRLWALAATNYGHFTSMQVRDGLVRGLGHHLDRLDRQSRELFGRGLAGDRVRELVRHALAGTPDASVRVTVYSGEGRQPSAVAPAELHVVVTAGPPAPAQTSPVRVCTVPYERDLPSVKHVATFGLTYHWRRARALGFDDALFVDRNGLVSEGTVWNVGFFDGSRVIWPEAAVLPGVSMLVLRDGLGRIGVPWEVRQVTPETTGDFSYAFSCNSINPVRQLSAVDSVTFAPDAAVTGMVASAYDAVPAEPLA